MNSTNRETKQRGWSLLLLIACVLLLLTALSKIIAGFGTASALNDPDIVFPQLKNRTLLFTAAGLELAVFLACMTNKSAQFQASLIAWVGSIFALYRIGLWIKGAKVTCGCLGVIARWLHISRPVADSISTLMLLYLLAVGFGFLLFNWISRDLGQAARRSLAST